RTVGTCNRPGAAASESVTEDAEVEAPRRQVTPIAIRDRTCDDRMASVMEAPAGGDPAWLRHAVGGQKGDDQSGRGLDARVASTPRREADLGLDDAHGGKGGAHQRRRVVRA